MTATSIFSGWIFEHTLFKEANQTLSKLVEHALNGGQPFICPMFGQSGTGKSEVIQDVLARYISHVNSQGHSRLLYVPMPTATNDEALAARIIKTIIGPIEVKGKKHQVLDRARETMHAAGICVLFLDEANHAAEVHTGRKAQTKVNRHLADWLKEIYELNAISLILNGLPHSSRILTDNDQLLSRAKRSIKLAPYSWADKDEKTQFIETIQAFGNHLQAHGWTLAAEPDTVIRGAYMSSGGLMRGIKKLFVGAEELGEKSKRLDLDLLATVFERDFPESRHGNPFRLESITDIMLNSAHQITLSLASAPTFQEGAAKGSSFSGRSKR